MDRKTAERLLKGGKKGIHTWNKKKQSGAKIPFLCGINLSGANLREVDFSGLNLTGAHLQGADLSEADLSACNLFEADLSDVDLLNADLSGASLTWTNLSSANLIKANLFEAELFETDLSWANLSNACMQDANLSGSDLTKANLSNANLSDAVLTRANLTRAILIRAQLPRANLMDADLDQANLSASNLQAANLRAANLSTANLVEAIFDRAILTQCKLCDAEISDWSIKDVICESVYWDRSGSETSYTAGDFESQFSAHRSIQLKYNQRMSAFDIATLPIILHGIEVRENCELYIKTIQQLTDSSVVKIAIGSSGNLDYVADQIEAIPKIQGKMDKNKIMPVLQEWILDEAILKSVANDELQKEDYDWDTAIAELDSGGAKKSANLKPNVQIDINKDLQFINQLQKEVSELPPKEGARFDVAAKVTLLSQLSLLSEKKIKSLDQPSLHVLKSALSQLSASSVSIACNVLHFGLSEKRVNGDSVSK